MTIAWDSGALKPVSVSVDENALVKQHEKQIRSIARRFSFDLDDMVQIGRIALIESARLWASREGHTAQFWTYARRRVLGAMMNYATEEWARKSVEVPECEGEDTPPPWAAQDTALEARENLSRLSIRESRILLSYAVEGDNVRSIAEALGESKSVIHRTLTGVIENLRERA